MIFDKDVAIVASDGLVLRANVFRPEGNHAYPVIMAHGSYGKDVHFSHAFKPQWEKLTRIYPGLCGEGSTGRFLRWETVDPERWIQDGYAVVQVDSRGTGKSPGYLDPFSPREIQDYFDCIEWAGTQKWANGKVGLLGVSYYGIEQWQVAALRPPHLAAICPWEGASDFYRDVARHGGICSHGFWSAWWPRQVLVNQHGNGSSTHVDADNGEITTGPALSPDLLSGNRSDFPNELLKHPLNDAWHRERSPDLSRIEVPILSAGNWGGPGVHMRGNIEGWRGAASKDKWLFMHVGTHYESFYLPEYVALQKRFFDRYLKGIDNGWDLEPKVQALVRTPTGTRPRRRADEFPLPETQFKQLHLHAPGLSLTEQPGPSAQVSYDAMGDGITFSTEPFSEELEIMGSLSLRVWVASDATDLDLFVVLRAFDPESKEVVFDGAHEPTPVTRGWLRASHRKLDEQRSLTGRPWHSHDEVWPLNPGEPTALDVEIWPTSMVFPKGYRLALTLMGKDFEFPGIAGRILHNAPADRDPGRLGSRATVYTGGDHESMLTLPIPPRQNP
jgi:predicted acyl esterase